MTTPEKTAVASHVAVITLCLVVAVCCVGLTVGASRIMDGMQVSLTHVNKPCKGSGSDKADNCGTLALGGQVMAKSGDMLVTTQQKEQAVIAHLDDLVDSLTTIAPHVAKTSDALTATASSASTAISGVQTHLTPVLDAATDTINTVNASLTRLTGSADVLLGNASTSVAAIQPLIGRSTLFVTHLDALATSPDIPSIIHEVNVGIGTGDHMLDTLDKVETKETHCILYPGFKCVVTGLIVPSVQIGGAAAAAFRK
jgi:hypothetical protein